MHPGVDPCDRDRPAPVPSGTKRVKVETPSVVSRADRVAPDAESRLSRLPRVSRGCTHRSHPEAGPRCVRQHAVRSAPGPAPRRRLALRLVVRERRAMRRTDFCLLTSSYEHPCLAGSRACFARGIAWFTPGRIRFGGPHRSVCRSSLEALSSSRDVCGRASDIRVAVPTPVQCRSRAWCHVQEPPKPAPRSTA